MEALTEFPLPENTFSIIGSNTTTDCPNGDCSTLTDGVVAWQSASIGDIAKEEIIVGSSHDSFNSDTAIEFILDKLKKEAQ